MKLFNAFALIFYAIRSLAQVAESSSVVNVSSEQTCKKDSGSLFAK